MEPQKNTSPVAKIHGMLIGVNNMIAHGKIVCEDFVRAVVTHEQSFMNATQVIRPRTLRNWIARAAAGKFNPHATLAAQHVEPIAAVYIAMCQTEALLENNKAHNAVYLLREEPFSGFVKIGNVTTGTLHARIKALQTGNPRRIMLVKYVPLDTADKVFALETLLHGAMAPLRVNGEWFACSDMVTLQLYGCLFDMLRNGTLSPNYGCIKREVPVAKEEIPTTKEPPTRKKKQTSSDRKKCGK